MSLPEMSADVILDQLSSDDLDITTTSLSLSMSQGGYGEGGFHGGDSGFESLERELAMVESVPAIEAVLHHGTASLQDHAKLIETHLREAELASIEDYVGESDNLVELSSQITQCDDMLANMEQTLHDFQHDLSTISRQIHGLQTQSASMGVKLRNRKAVCAHLGEFLSAVVLPTELVEGVVEEDVTEAYLEHLLTLSKKLGFCQTQQNGGGGGGGEECVALNDVLPALEKLRVKSCSKVREFLLKKVHALRKPGTNVQMIQRNVLLKYRHFVRYLRQHGGSAVETAAAPGEPNAIYVELTMSYADAVGGGLKSNFEAYVEALPRLRADPAVPGDVLGSVTRLSNATGTSGGGAAPSLTVAMSQAAVGMSGAFAEAAGALGAMFQKGDAAASRGGAMSTGGVRGGGVTAGGGSGGHSPFRLGDRATVAFAHLTEGGSPALVPHVESDARRYHPFERLFASAHKLLADTATSEYLFIGDFFGERRLFSGVFEAPLAAVERWVVASANEPHNVFVDATVPGASSATPGVPIGVTTYGDAIGCLLCIAATQRLRVTMAKRRVPALDAYLDRILMILWPRAKALLESHITSLEEPRNVAAVLRSAATPEGGMNPRRSDLPRIAKSCGELLASCRMLSGSVGDGQIGHSLERLREAVVGFARVCAGLGINASTTGASTAAATSSGKSPSSSPSSVALVVLAYHAVHGALVVGASDDVPGDEASIAAGEMNGNTSSIPHAEGATDAPVAGDLAYFSTLLARERAHWVERVLEEHMGELISFVRWAEAATDAERDSEGPKRGGVAMRFFAERWSGIIAAVNKAVEACFGPPRKSVEDDLASGILKQALTQFLLYHTRAKEALSKIGEKGERILTEVGVGMPAIVFEIKKSTGEV